MISIFVFFFFKQKTAYEMRISDWSSDVCSSDLPEITLYPRETAPRTNLFGVKMMMIAPVGGAKHRLLPSCSTIALLAALALPMRAEAAGTRAGSTISNTASASFDTGAGTTTVDSNRVDLLVDELLEIGSAHV